jgi:predicted kinase
LAKTARPTLVVVSGPPASGKPTLAHGLAKPIPCPAVCRDEIKEGMVHAHGGDFQGAPGDTLTQRTFPLFFEVLRSLLEGDVTVVAEAAFQDQRWRAGLEPLAGMARLRIVHCTTDPAVASERAARRATGEGKRPAHGDSSSPLAMEEWRRAFQSFDRISLDAPAIELDTTDGYQPDLPEIVAFVNSAGPGRDRR